jgi:type I restriction enzyme S subunit
MEEWKEYSIGQLCSSVCSGGTPSSKHSEYYDGNIPWLNTKEINFNRIYSTEKRITEDGLNNSSAKWIKENAVIVAMYGATAGKTAISKIPLTTNQACCNLTINSQIADYRFVYYHLCNKFVELASLANGGAQQNLNSQIIKEFPIFLPSLSEQKKIADVLSTLDDKIEVNRQINDNLEQQAQALFKSWLSKCKDEVTIGDLSLNITDYTKCNQEKVVLINSSDVTEGHFEHHILSENKDLKGHFKKRFQKGDILYSQVRPRNRHWGYCTFDADNYLASTQLMVIRNKPELISSILLYQYIIDERVWLDFTLKTETRSGTFPQGNYEELSSIKVPFGAETTQISSVLESLYLKIFSNEKELVLLTTLRDTLLPKLMSGEMKVNEIKA